MAHFGRFCDAGWADFRPFLLFFWEARIAPCLCKGLEHCRDDPHSGGESTNCERGIEGKHSRAAAS